MYTHIVVGTDGSDTAQVAVDHAAGLARCTGATLHLVSAYAPVSLALSGAAVGMGSLPVTTGEHSDVRAWTEDLLAGVAEAVGGPGLDVRVHAVAGPAAAVLPELAQQVGADLIVVGSRGMTGKARLLGSVPNAVAHHAPCSVLIVHTR